MRRRALALPGTEKLPNQLSRMGVALADSHSPVPVGHSPKAGSRNRVPVAHSSKAGIRNPVLVARSRRAVRNTRWAVAAVVAG
jgi:hypothetical protein